MNEIEMNHIQNNNHGVPTKRMKGKDNELRFLFIFFFRTQNNDKKKDIEKKM